MNENRAIEELAFIKDIIKDSRRSFALRGKPYILWGSLVVIGLFLEYIQDTGIIDFRYNYFVWIGLIGIGWLYAYLESRKSKREVKSISLAGKILGSVWFACGISMTIFGFLGTISGAIKGVYISPALSLVLAIAYFVTGVVYDYKWQRNLSIGWWLGAIVMFFFPGNHATLIMAFMMIAFQIIPGIILLKKVKEPEAIEV